MVIEVDGGQHYEMAKHALDVVRDEYFRSIGLCVLRFSNLDVLRELDNVLEVILMAVQELTLANPPLAPLYERGAYAEKN